MWMALALLVFIALLYLGYFFTKPILASFKNQPATSYRHEFVEPGTGSVLKGSLQGRRKPGRFSFPSIFDAPAKVLSLIVPAYNEENRIDIMMKETLDYLQQRERADKSFSFEIIIVDDGSTDATAKVAMEYVTKYGAETIRLMRLPYNQGKGGAVQQGMLHARGQMLLMVDSDGATKIEDLDELERRLKKSVKGGMGIAVGSRAQYEKEPSVAQRSWLRNLLMHGFHCLVATLCVKNIRDTQCGFKLFTRNAAQLCFLNQHLRGWSFDVEILYIAQRYFVPIEEVPVHWQEIPGSKLSVLKATLQMGRDLVVIRLSYMLGLWRIANPSSKRNSLS